MSKLRKRILFQDYFRIQLDDPATPGFCSFPKNYFGTLADIQKVVEKMSEDGVYQDTAKAFQQFCGGDTTATHTVCYNPTQLMHPVELIAKERFDLGEVSWTHKNIYDCDYRLRAKYVSAEQILFAEGDSYYRCVRPYFQGVEYQSEASLMWFRLDDRVWGNRCVVELHNGNLKFLLYVVETHTKDLEQILSEMWTEKCLDFSSACDEIFGNG